MKTRYFVIVSLLVLLVGIGTGLVAYYVGVPQLGLGRSVGPDELRYVPPDATIVAYADVHEVMTSPVRQKIRRALPAQENGQREFKDETGIDIERDIDHVVAFLAPPQGGGLVLARGRFDEVRIESLMRDHGATVDQYRGKRLLIAPSQGPGSESFALSFIEPGVAAVGSSRLVRSAVDLQNGSANVRGNPDLMNLVRGVADGQANAWAVGRMDPLIFQSNRLPPQIAGQIPPVSWFSVSGRVDDDISATIRADANDEEGAKNLRDVVQGFIALARLQASSRPELKATFDSMQLGGTGKTVTLSFSLPAAAFDAMAPERLSPRAPTAPRPR